MRTLVVYYSRSGTARTVAGKLAADLGADLEEIACTHYGLGFWGYMRAARDSLKDRMPAIGPARHAPSNYDLVVIAGPMWAFRAATPVRAYLRREAPRLPRVAFLLTLGGAAPDKAFREMETLAASAPAATLALREQDVKAGRVAAALQAFAASLQPLPKAA